MKNTIIFTTAIAIFIFINFSQTDARMTMTQIRNAMKPLGKKCLEKTGLSPEVQAGQHKGEFPEDEALMCYHSCLLKLAKISDKNGNINLNTILKQADLMMPEDSVARAKAVTTDCFGEIKSTEICRMSFEFVKCYFLNGPEVVFFP
ncbi:general odorant-binding protein 83a-like [Microplitis demolitor]|uniref:general odorant-binding protein 83a-like n=1 Tax=Microplitis demolitor TaxID=69319 RepID=UPI0004CD4340|nr:general odorant-binding protein 83a-like [Microplitis demolitor]